MGVNQENYFRLEFRELDVSPGKTAVQRGKFIEFISPTKGYFLNYEGWSKITEPYLITFESSKMDI